VTFYSNGTNVEIARLENNANAIQFNADSTFQIVQTQVAPEAAREIINLVVGLQHQAAATPMVAGTPPPAAHDAATAPSPPASEQRGDRPVAERQAEIQSAPSAPATPSGTSTPTTTPTAVSLLATSVTESSATPTLANSALQAPRMEVGQTATLQVTTLPAPAAIETAAAGGAGPLAPVRTTTATPATETTPSVPGNTPPALTTVGLGPILEDASAQSFALAPTDSDGDSLSYQVIGAGPRLGSVVVNGSSLSYTPSLNANGVDTFTLLVSDGRGGTIEQPVSVTITPQNDAPQAPATRSIATLQDRASAPLPIGATDVDGDTLDYVLMEGAGPRRGQVAFADGRMIYTPNAGEIGEDSFTVQISDRRGGLIEQRVSVVIEAVGLPNGAPVLDVSRPQVLAGALVEDTPALTTAGVVFFADSNASDEHTGASTLVSVVRSRAGGGTQALTADLGSFSAVLDSQDRSVRWTYAASEPALELLAAGDTVTITYLIAITDPAGAVLTQPVVITITGTNDGPRVTGALNAAVSEAQSQRVGIDLLAGASDPEGDPISVQASSLVVSAPAGTCRSSMN
jgi:VCBS repeat-containing protein